jgi:hypothetical protein
MPDGDMEATVVIGATPAPPAASDDDLEATLVQGGGAWQAGKAPNRELSSGTPAQPASNESDLEATVVINGAGKPSRTGGGPPEKGTDEDLEATLIETPRGTAHPAGQPPPMPPAPPQPPREEGLPESASVPGQDASDNLTEDDDDVMEQTVIIRSDIKKE